MSLYGEYIAERLGDHIIENSCGFATYRFTDEKTCYVVDIYIKPECRGKAVASGIMDIIVKTAKDKGCTRVLGSVVPSAKGSTGGLKAMIGYGMLLDSATTDFVVLRKDL